MWQPWIGSQFAESRILLLAESCYDWQDKTGEWVFAKSNQPVENIEAVRVNPTDGAKTIKTLTRAICSSDRPISEQSSARWDRFAYTNYVPVSVGRGATVRPTKEAWSQAEQEWPFLLAHIQPKAILVLGKGLWGYMPETQDVRTKNIQAFAVPGAEMAWCFAVQHPAHGPSWSVYAAWIAALEKFVQNGDLELAMKAFA